MSKDAHGYAGLAIIAAASYGFAAAIHFARPQWFFVPTIITLILVTIVGVAFLMCSAEPEQKDTRDRD